MRGWRAAKIMHSVRSVASSNLQLFTTSTGGPSFILPKEVQDRSKHVIERHPPLEIRHRRWRIAFTLDGAMEKGSRGRGETNPLRALGSLEICPDAIRVFRASVFLGAPGVRTRARRQEAVKEAEPFPPRILKPSLCTRLPFSLAFTLRDTLSFAIANGSSLTGANPLLQPH